MRHPIKSPRSFATPFRFWRLDGVFHREDGPAIEFSDGDKEWWVRGVRTCIELGSVHRPRRHAPHYDPTEANGEEGDP